MSNSGERSLEAALTAPFCFGQILVRKTSAGSFLLSHRDDETTDRLKTFQNAEDAIEIGKYDDAGNYRSLKTAPDLQHGWRLEISSVEELKRALDHFYPGRLAVFAAWKDDRLQTTPLRETLDRQSGMYRVAAKISDAQIDDLVADFCRSDGGCLRTILWKRASGGAIASAKLPKEKFDPGFDQAGIEAFVSNACRLESVPGTSASALRSATAATIPLLCQEACNLLVAECRKVVKGE